MSDTPRTDNAALCWERDQSYIGATVPIEFARELERENTKLREIATAADDFVNNVENHHVFGGGPVRDDGSYMRLRGVVARASFVDDEVKYRHAKRLLNP